MYYHVVADLEKRFGSAEEAVAAYTDALMIPQVSPRRMDDEDGKTLRICVAPTIEGCITALLNLLLFERCFATGGGVALWKNEHEAYPILVLSFLNPSNVYTPTKAEVPDVERTGEAWIMEPTKPDSVQLYWLGYNSIDVGSRPISYNSVCRSVRFLTEEQLAFKCHPWLNGRGHFLGAPDINSAITGVERLQFEKETLLKTIAEDEHAELLDSDSEDEVCIYDMDWGKYIIFHLTNYSSSDLLPKIHFGASLSGKCDIDKARLTVAKVMATLPREVLMTLSYVFFVSTISDMEQLVAQLDIEDEIPDALYGDDDEDGNALSTELIGLSWFIQNSVIINIDAIKKTNHELWADMPAYEQEELEKGVWTTLLHELRHQQLDCCPYEMAWLSESETSEEAVEQWGRRMYERLVECDML